MLNFGIADDWGGGEFNSTKAQLLIEEGILIRSFITHNLSDSIYLLGHSDFRSSATVPVLPSPKKKGIGAIAGGVVGGILLLAIVGYFVIVCLRHRSKKGGHGLYAHEHATSSGVWMLGHSHHRHERSQSGQSDLSGYSGHSGRSGSGSYPSTDYHRIDPYDLGSPEGVGATPSPRGHTDLGAPTPFFRANHPFMMSPPLVPREMQDDIPGLPLAPEEKEGERNILQRAVDNLKVFKFGKGSGWSRPGLFSSQRNREGHERSWSLGSNVSSGSNVSYFSLSSLGRHSQNTHTRSNHSHSHSQSHSHSHSHSYSHSRSFSYPTSHNRSASFGKLTSSTPPREDRGGSSRRTHTADLQPPVDNSKRLAQSSTDTIVPEGQSDSDREARRHRRGRRHKSARHNTGEEAFSPIGARHPSQMVTTALTQSPSPPTVPRMVTTITQNPSPPARIRANQSRTPSRTRTRDRSVNPNPNRSHSRGNSQSLARVHFDTTSPLAAGQGPPVVGRERRMPTPPRSRGPPTYSEATNAIQVIGRGGNNGAG